MERNPSCYIMKLPTELLSYILAMVANNRRLPSVAIHVCKTWRNVAVNLPQLWGFVDCSNVEQAEEMIYGPLVRSLRLTCHRWSVANMHLWRKTMEECVERIRELDISKIPSASIFDTLSLNTERPASDLRVLRASIRVPPRSKTKTKKKSKAKTLPWDQITRFMDRAMPRLRVLGLDDFPVLPWNPERIPQLSNLTSISIRMWYNSEHANFSQLVPILQASTFVEYLSLFNVVPDMENIPGDLKISLPCLENIFITTSECDALLIAQSLHFPQKTTIALSSEGISLDTIDPGAIVKVYSHISPTSTLIRPRSYASLDLQVSGTGILVNATSTFGKRVSFKLSGFSENDVTPMLLELAAQFCATFHHTTYADFSFPDSSMDCDWSAFLRPLRHLRRLGTIQTTLTSLHNFFAGCNLRMHAPLLESVSFCCDSLHEREIFDDGEEWRTIEQVVRSLVSHLHDHIERYDTLRHFVFSINPNRVDGLYESFSHCKDFKMDFEECCVVFGTRGDESA